MMTRRTAVVRIVLAFTIGVPAAHAVPIRYTMPDDGFVSMIVRNEDGVVVRQPLTCEYRAKGKHTLEWDGLTMPIAGTPGTPGTPVPAGEYTWHAITHAGIGIRLRGWAYHGPSDPWDAGPTSYWGGDHGQPISCATDGTNVYLGWSGAEAGKALIAMGPRDNVIWAAGFHFNSAELIAADGGLVFYPSSGLLRRVSAEDGKLVPWPGTRSGEIPIHAVLGDPDGSLGMPGSLSGNAEGMDARNGKLYLSFSVWTIHPHHIRSWWSFLKNLRKGGPTADAIWLQLDERTRNVIDNWLKNGGPEEKALGSPHYQIPDTRKTMISALRAQLYSPSLAPGKIQRTVDERTRVNRRHLEEAFPDDLVKARSDFVAVIDIATGRLLRTIDVPSPGKIAVVRDDLAYLFSERHRLLALNPLTGETRILLRNQRNHGGLATDDEGNIYIAYGYPHYQVFVYSPEGVLLRKLGKQGGRIRFGPWNPAGMSVVYGLAVDSKKRVWAAEMDATPKRFSVWDAGTGEFVTEFLGPTHYGASGAAINPVDPDLMIGEGCEFRIDPETGRSKFLGIAISEIPFGAARYCTGSNGRLYLAGTFKPRSVQISIWERLGDARYAYRGVIRQNTVSKQTVFWADENGDQAAQANEVQMFPSMLEMGGYNLWSMNMNTDLTFYGVDRQTGKTYRFKVSGFTPCGAPKYDLDSVKELPAMAGPLSSPDNRLVVSCDYDNLFRCYEAETGKLLWTYPNAFHGVHGSHYAPGPAPGFIRGAFGFVGSAALPEPVGTIWAINSNVGDWHVLTEDGYYLTSLFETEEDKQKWPKAVPGAVMDSCPAGLGGEDFGGSLIQGKDGKVYAQAGKLAVWNTEVVGLDTIREIPGGTIHVKAEDIVNAELVRGRLLQAGDEQKRIVVKRLAPAFTGKLHADFKKAEAVRYQKDPGTPIVSACAWDDTNLYLAWRVNDSTPWTNAADEAAYLYAAGDTVDFQLGTDPGADKDRETAVPGDLRISIGNLGGTPTVVLYEETATEKNSPRTFSSGVVKKFVVRRCEILEGARVEVSTRKDGYTVEAAIPLADIPLAITPGMELRGDFGVTFSDPAGQDTAKRSYWSNRGTGIVNDEVFELRLQPNHWGTLVFEE